ncbi:protein containing ankyrin repeat [Sulfurimonas gotlandica GD1]|uniref:Protein containing ankyrin repeat n=1 Tax=Sulfurimonas gotlandica (strain DSM 19862 / JCM 16533 / GD1) TaxID=929558 RepID=B6BNC9_SULGG|nr:ankyrin repeat domain-containing protein [Sulfurimonas gotlandica]EDZ61385.1 ankyrin repeat protein [Sulfurimonas gotlandica GD1]EHP30999.1 protein containing ankyrin repeat [Sulfurimonas gotlandica GD1]
MQDTNTFEMFEKIVYDNDLELFKSEVQKLDDINIQNKYGWTLLHVSIRRDRAAMVDFLLDNGADINKVDGVGWTPLMEAIMDDMPNLCRVLVDRGADKSIANARGVTAPMLAQKFGRVDMYDALS